MALLVWPLLVFAYYKQKHILINWLMVFALLTAALAILGSGEYFLLAVAAQVIGIPLVFLSAKFTAWCIKRHVNRKKTD